MRVVLIVDRAERLLGVLRRNLTLFEKMTMTLPVEEQCHCPLISYLVWAYPRIFKGYAPEEWSVLPNKWRPGLILWMSGIQCKLPEEAVRALIITAVRDRGGKLEFRWTFRNLLSAREELRWSRYLRITQVLVNLDPLVLDEKTREHFDYPG
jgi:hypothetical protein